MKWNKLQNKQGRRGADFGLEKVEDVIAEYPLHGPLFIVVVDSLNSRLFEF